MLANGFDSLPAELRSEGDSLRRGAAVEGETQPWTVHDDQLELTQVPLAYAGANDFRRAGVPHHVEFRERFQELACSGLSLLRGQS